MVKLNPNKVPAAVLEKLNEINADVVWVDVMAEDFFYKYHLTNGQVLHHFLGHDTGFPHNHPWPFETEILAGWYVDVSYMQNEAGLIVGYTERHEAGKRRSVGAKQIHLITDCSEGGFWTLVSPGIWEQEPGFYNFTEEGIWFRFHYEPEMRLIEHL